MLNLKINEISIPVALCVFTVYHSTTLFNASNLQSAIFALSDSAVAKPLLCDVSRPIIFLLVDELTSVVQ